MKSASSAPCSTALRLNRRRFPHSEAFSHSSLWEKDADTSTASKFRWKNAKKNTKAPKQIDMKMRSNLNDRTRPGALFNWRATQSGDVLSSQRRPGALFNRRAKSPNAVEQGDEIGLPLTSGAGAPRGKHWLAFAGVYLFTLMLYARPNDLLPALGDFRWSRLWRSALC